MVNRELISEVIKEKGWTVKEFSEISTVPKATLERILNGSTENPGILTIRDIAVPLGLSLNDIVGVECAEPGSVHHIQVIHAQSAATTQLYNRMLFEKDRRIQQQGKWLSVAVVINIAQLLYQMLRWMIDIANPEKGWIRLEDANITFAAVLLIVVFALAALGAMFWFFFHRQKNTDDSAPQI